MTDRKGEGPFSSAPDVIHPSYDTESDKSIIEEANQLKF